MMNEIGMLFFNGNSKEALKKLENLLSKENKLKYQKIIIALFKLSLIENDLSFIEAISFYNQINETTLSDFLTVYKKQFFTFIEEGKLEKAKIIKEIIFELQALENEYMDKCFDDAMRQKVKVEDKTEKCHLKDISNSKSERNSQNEMNTGKEMYKLIKENPRNRVSYFQKDDYKKSDVPLIKARYF